MKGYATRDPTSTKAELEAAKHLNDFVYEPVASLGQGGVVRSCPLAAHIRKTNPRESEDPNRGDKGHKLAKIIRAGIPYGPAEAWKKGDGLKRGLLFACYQGSIDDGFRHIQVNWCNNDMFPDAKDLVGVDPIIGQHKRPEMQQTLLVEGTGGTAKKYLPMKPQLVTFRGGEYFFAPSIKALREELSAV